MLKDAVKGRVPLIHVKSEDTVYAHSILKELVGVDFMPFVEDGTGIDDDTVYYRVSRTGEGPSNARALFAQLRQKNSCLVYLNLPRPPIEFMDLGVITPPPTLLKKLLSAIVAADVVDQTVQVLGGLSIKDAINAIKVTRARENKLSFEGLNLTRRLMLTESQGLTLVDPYMPVYIPNSNIAEWVAKEKQFFLKGDSRLRPRGLMFKGPPGTGKTQGAKYIAQQWGVPLYRLGSTFLEKWQGNSEGNFDMALKKAESAEPAIMLIDEIEKFFMNSGSDSTGTMARVMGSLLWWLQEHDARVLTIMTTNDEKKIPPELYRPGRIDRHFTFKKLLADEAMKVAEAVYASYIGSGPPTPPNLLQMIDEAASAVTSGDGLSHSHIESLVREYVKSHEG